MRTRTPGILCDRSGERTVNKQYKGERYPVAEDLCKRGFYLPSASSLTLEEIEYVAEVIREACPALR